MKATHFRLLTVVLAVVLFAAMGVGIWAASSGTNEKDGLTVVLSTDKETYADTDSVTVSLDVTNNSGKTATINSEITVPSGMVITSGSAKATATVNDGATNTAKLVLSMEDSGGDGWILWVILGVLVVGGVILLLIFGKNGKRFTSMLLFLVMVGSVVSTAVPVRAEGAAESLSVSKTVKIGDTDVTIEAAVSYTFADEVIDIGVYTREQAEQALVAAAWAYYLKGGKLQYCSQEITDGLSKYTGGSYRLTEDAAPEFGTDDTTIYSVCSDFVYKVYYEALGHRLFGAENYLGSTTSDFWMKSEDVALFRWIKSSYTLSDLDIKYGVTTDKQLTTEQAREYMANWAENLRPGDVIVATGHAFIYVGNGYVMDCWGGKYDESTGVEKFEANGSVHVLHTVEDLYLEGDDPIANSGYEIKDDSDKNWFTVFRPLDAFIETQSETDMGQDIIDMVSMTTNADKLAAVATRSEYPGLEINRTVNMTPYGTVTTGDKLTYNVAITNCTTDPDWLTYWQRENADYAGVGYTDLVVKETVPEGTALVEGSITEGGVYADGVITWTVDIAAGEHIDLSYQVTVTAAVGCTIVNDGGCVGSIASNSISNTVGGSKLSGAALTGLTALAGTPKVDWRETYNISKLGTDLEFAERVYQAAMGIGLELPTVQEIMDNLFTYKRITNESPSERYPDPMTADLFVLNETVPAEYQTVADMMADGYIGGQKLYFAQRGLTMNEFGLEYLEAGDILVYADVNDEGTVIGTEVIVYAGNGTLLTLNAKNQSSVLTASTYNNGDFAFVKLWNALAKDVFFLLRPSQAYADINTLAYDKADEPSYGEEPKDEGEGPQLGDNDLSADKLAALAGLAADGWTQKNTNFAEEVYAAIGLDITAATQSTSIASILKGILFFDDEDPSAGYDYVLQATMLEDYKQLSNMLVPNLRGGPDMVDYTDNQITIQDLKPGDVLNLVNRSNSCYWVSVYLGDGKLLVSEYAKDGYQTYSIRDFSDDTDGSRFAQFITCDDVNNWVWECYYVLRPSQGFYDINDPAYDPYNAAPDITTGEYYVVVEHEGKYYAMSTTTPDDCKFDAVEVTIENGVITTPNVDTWTVTVKGVEGTALTVTLSSGASYLVRQDTSSNIRMGASDTANNTWTLTYDSGKECYYLVNTNGDVRFLTFAVSHSGFKAYVSEREDRIGEILLIKG